MNKKQMILAAVMIVAATNLSRAQFFYPALEKISPAQKESLERNFAADLSSWNTGIVESSLAIVAMIKLDLPAENLPMIREKVEDLVTSGTTPVIRYKAYLAESVFANPAMFKTESTQNYREPDDFFHAVAGRLSQTLLSAK